MVELLSPVGNFETLKAAVQNGADAVYFGAKSFSARAFAENFDDESLSQAITYAKLRGVKTHLTLNTLLKNDELQDAINLAKKAYEYGIDAIIVQDLGLANYLIKNLPELPIHASTQMTIHNLEGANKLQKLGFERVVLSRELTLHEIEYICKNSSAEIECFVHGALCISYSGQCLFSSLVGGRSGNRGKCAQSCRLPYELLENGKKIDKGYLLSTRDLCGLDFLPYLIQAGVKSFKIEGRMKSSEYVATVTKIYRKYIDLANECIKNNNLEAYVVNPSDKKDLMQVFNRGNFSNGHLENTANRSLIFKDKPNNMGLFLGIVQKFQAGKGHITVKLKEPIEVGDTIALENETGSYTVSELLQGNQNIKGTKPGDTVTLGRMKGNIKPGDKIYKISSKTLSLEAKNSFSKENKKIPLNAEVNIKLGEPISILVTPCGSSNKLEIYKDMKIECSLPDAIPVAAIKKPLDIDSIRQQLSKTTDTPYEFVNIKVNLDNNSFLPKISMLNELRRLALSNVQEYAISNIRKTIFLNNLAESVDIVENNYDELKPQISVLFNILNNDFNYENLDKRISNIYIPLKYFTVRKFEENIKILANKFNVYIYLPTIIRANYRNLLIANIENTLKSFDIKGFIVSNIGNLELLKNAEFNLKEYELIGNYTLNVFNNQAVNHLKDLGLNKFTVSAELDKTSTIELCKSNVLDKELIVYGKLPLMNIRYCPIGKTNLCYPECGGKCMSGNIYELKDRMDMNFRILPDSIQTVSTIYNCKTLSILPIDFIGTQSVRADFLDESIDKINEVIDTISNGNRFEGKEFTNGNLNRNI